MQQCAYYCSEKRIVDLACVCMQQSAHSVSAYKCKMQITHSLSLSLSLFLTVVATTFLPPIIISVNAPAAPEKVSLGNCAVLLLLIYLFIYLFVFYFIHLL